jgi:hypothetical protein
MNVASDFDVWIDYYMEFPLVHLRNRKVQAIWKPKVRAADGLVVGDGWVLFRGGYKCQDTYSLVKLESHGESQLVAKVEFKDQRGARLASQAAVGRGSEFHLLQGSHRYRVDVARVVDLLAG